ncbi:MULTISPECIES: FecR family protein [unclassified Pedobacter]|uniref:FecR family protein n=1 Tax=unclassified Pedobacter TaxID=2628915 RepID=UPI00141EBC8E|nr:MULTISPECIES: FecR family protein [unclassified Pedobacter]NII83251.1 ferric-dicitrate binding protein FerR (iron transport regulator) [Pedobacter sp. SG908]NMN37121.1 ferric-dicitrate binding protein FerR (iron transport regulator) [Pedobacter sp. SG918]
MKTEQAKQLIQHYLDGTASAKEVYLVDSFVEQQLLENIWNADEAQKAAFGEKLKARIDAQRLKGEDNRQNQVVRPKTITRRLWIIAASAAVLALCLMGSLFAIKNRTEDRSERYANDVAPGGNRAILTLADGRKIDLSDSKTGELAITKGLNVKKAADGLLIFSVIDNGGAKEEGRNNTVTTPSGGQYQVKLPDGTLVWLNAETKFTFPSHFSEKNRRVELDGEAYFEVSKDKNHPFIVKSKKQEVEVLGTHFNINSYENSLGTKTTLLEGSVKVKGTRGEKIIAPGEQSVLYGNTIEVNAVDPTFAIDWKNGEFRFKNEPLPSIMQKLSRWYSVQFVMNVHSEQMPSFSGSVSRFDNISEVLKMLEETGNIKFYINGKVITVK